MEKPLLVNDISRIAWACRRGMLELDVLIGNFFKAEYLNLAPEDQQRFVNLLACSDPEIFQWLLGQQIPDDVDLKRIVDLIRQHAKK